MLNLSSGIQQYSIESKVTLRAELINSYTLNTESINPLDKDVIHVAITVINGHLTQATLAARSVWQKVQWIKY